MRDDTLSPTPLPVHPWRQDAVARPTPFPDSRGRLPFGSVMFVRSATGDRFHVLPRDVRARETVCGLPDRWLPRHGRTDRVRLALVCKSCIRRADPRAIGYEFVPMPTR